MFMRMTARGSDATGNACNGVQAAEGISEAQSPLEHLKGSAAIASVRLDQARQRQSKANADVQRAKVELKVSLKTVGDAEKPVRR